MLTDPLKLPLMTPAMWDLVIYDVLNTGATNWNTLFASAGNSVDFHTTDLSPGATKRIGMIGSNQAVMSIGHSTSNENAPFVTDRSVMRIDLKKVNSETGKPVTASAYLVTTAPRGSDFSVADILQLGRTVAAIPFTGTNGLLFTAATMDVAAYQRVIAGEP